MYIKFLKSFLKEKIRTKAISVLFTTVHPTSDTVSDKYVLVKYRLNDYRTECIKRVLSLSVMHTGILGRWGVERKFKMREKRRPRTEVT